MKFPFPGSISPKAVATADGATHYVWEEKVSGALAYAVFYSRLNKAGTKWTPKVQISTQPYGEVPFIFMNGTKLVVLYQSKDTTTKAITNYQIFSTDGGKTWG